VCDSGVCVCVRVCVMKGCVCVCVCDGGVCVCVCDAGVCVWCMGVSGVCMECGACV